MSMTEQITTIENDMSMSRVKGFYPETEKFEKDSTTLDSFVNGVKIPIENIESPKEEEEKTMKKAKSVEEKDSKKKNGDEKTVGGKVFKIQLKYRNENNLINNK